MQKIIFFLAISFMLVQAEDTYVFEAKGEFAKELKSLVEKYSKSGKVNVTVYKKEEPTSTTKSIFSILSGEDAKDFKNADIALGKKIYLKSCYKCHGIDGLTNSYANSRKLATLKPSEIYNSLKSYRDDDDFGGSTKFIMKNEADLLVTNEMKSVAVYIATLNSNSNNLAKKDLQNSLNVEESEEESSSYLQ